jgi:hypothetical protein
VKRLLVALSALLSAATLAGCAGSAAVIARTPSGGVLGLDGDREEAMADARRQMSDHCGGAYSIVGERKTAGLMRGRTIVEHQIRYACGAEPDRPVTPPPVPPVPSGVPAPD